MVSNYNKDEPDALGGLFPATLRGLATGIILALLLALIFSAAAIMMDDPSKFLRLFALTALFAGAFADGLASAKAYPDGGLLSGIVGGVLYVLFLWLVSLFFRGGVDSTQAVSPLGMALGYAGCVAFSAVGGLFGRPRQKKVGDGKNSPAALARKQLKTNRR